jgi:uncharacterized membrane protein
MSEESSPKTDIGVSLFLIVVCSLVLWEARRIPPGVFDPLGSAPIPRAVAGLIIFLCLVVMVQALRRWMRGERATGETEFSLRYLDAVGVVVVTLIYILGLALELTSFAILTTVFLTFTIGFLNRFRRRALMVALVLGLVMGFGCEYLFTQVFVVDLPTS